MGLRACRAVAVSGFCYQLRQNEAALEEEEGAGLAELEAKATACLCDVREPEDRKVSDSDVRNYVQTPSGFLLVR